MNIRWAAQAESGRDALRSFQEDVPVRLIATPRAEFVVASKTEEVGAVVTRNVAGYDHFPVVEWAASDEPLIVGLLDIGGHEARASVPVSQVMRSLRETDFIGADASLLDFIREADVRPFRFVVSGSAINGLVALSDLQRLPVRASLFAMITHLEMTMAHAIRRRFRDSSAWLEYLPTNDQKKIAAQVRRATRDRELVDDLLYTTFSQKSLIIARQPEYACYHNFETDVKAIRDLRNAIAHANEYASTSERAASVCSLVRQIDFWIAHFGD